VSIITGVSVGVGVIFVIVIILLIVFIVMWRKNVQKQKQFYQMDNLIDEQLLKEEFGNIPLDVDPFWISLDKLELESPIKRLGSGGNGVVFQTRWNGLIVAVKVFDINDENYSEDDFRQEASLLSKLRHPNVISFFGVSVSPIRRFIVMECMERSLEAIIYNLEKGNMLMDLQTKIQILVDVAQGIEYLHTMNPKQIIHRDLKPANILQDKDGRCKL